LKKIFFLVGGRAEWSGTEAEGWIFFFQAFRDNMFLLFECFLEKIMPF